eukprot:CAMPEP_0178415138 /NCGR_PEP_ID=MMETSP0689_2-20121128/23399_1 /TAXON_ID=160604 /ORGANISM="Amphidinium massartii, Strain CS-259" /LENGTH=76 /DNA_ID=CAMNT_0020036453 /DNA_START=772 /DNA_END=999 /DNA_ORIENTATION=-
MNLANALGTAVARLSCPVACTSQPGSATGGLSLEPSCSVTAWPEATTADPCHPPILSCIAAALAPNRQLAIAGSCC